MVYYVIAPIAWKFFLSYQNLNSTGIPIRLEAKMGEYLALMMRFIFAFGLAFQLPVALTLMAKANIVDYQTLSDNAYRQWQKVTPELMGNAQLKIYKDLLKNT